MLKVCVIADLQLLGSNIKNREMKQIFSIVTFIILLLASCQNEEKRNFKEEKQRIFSDLYNDSQIKSEYFEINSFSDTTLIT